MNLGSPALAFGPVIGSGRTSPNEVFERGVRTR